MKAIEACELPPGALLHRYRDEGAYTDCYTTALAGPVSHAAYVEAFYTTSVFKLERWVLARLVARPSTDDQAREMAQGLRESFAAWTVEARATNQLLLCDFRQRTRSWLMTEPTTDGHGTRLLFGSAVVPTIDRRNGASRMGGSFRALLGFHRLYSRVLLRAAAGRLMRDRPDR